MQLNIYVRPQQNSVIKTFAKKTLNARQSAEQRNFYTFNRAVAYTYIYVMIYQFIYFLLFLHFISGLHTFAPGHAIWKG